MRFLILILSLAFVGCATTKPVFVKDGRQVHEATCNGTARTIAVCHQLAAEQCGGSYEVMGGENNSRFVPTANGYLPSQQRSLLYFCKDQS